MTVMLTISVLTFTSRASSSSDDLEASAGSGTCRSSLGLCVGESFPLLILGPVGTMLEVAALALPLLDSGSALHPLLGSLLVLLHHILLADRDGVFQVLLTSCEDPLHAVLQDPLLLVCNSPRGEGVDVGRIVDPVLEVLLGADSHFGAELELV